MSWSRICKKSTDSGDDCNVTRVLKGSTTLNCWTIVSATKALVQYLLQLFIWIFCIRMSSSWIVRLIFFWVKFWNCLLQSSSSFPPTSTHPLDQGEESHLKWRRMLCCEFYLYLWSNWLGVQPAPAVGRRVHCMQDCRSLQRPALCCRSLHSTPAASSFSPDVSPQPVAHSLSVCSLVSATFRLRVIFSF